MKFHLQNNSDTKTKFDTVPKAVWALWPTHFKDIQITLLCRSLSHHSHDHQNKSNCSQSCVIAGLEAGRGDPPVYGPHRFSSGSNHNSSGLAPQLPPTRQALGSPSLQRPSGAWRSCAWRRLGHLGLHPTTAPLPSEMLHTSKPVTTSIRAQGQSASQGKLIRLGSNPSSDT